MKVRLTLGTCFGTLATVLLGCDRGATVPVGTAQRDSAGVLIVESSAPAWRRDEAWSVDSVPFLSLGVEDGDTAQVFSGVAGGIRRADRSILVVDRDSRQLRLFNSEGKLLKVAGRNGIGPGEFRYPLDLGVCGDETWLVDLPGRMLVWTQDLEFVRTFSTGDVPMWPMMCLDGRVLLKEDVRDEAPNNTIYVSHLDLQLAPAVTNPVRTPLVRIPSREYIVVVTGRTGIGFVHPFGKETHLARYGDGIAMTGFHGAEIRTIGLDGTLRRIVRGPAEDLSIPPSLVSQYRGAKLDIREERFRAALESIDMPMPDSRPAFTALMVDSEDNFWARRFTVPGTVANEWAVFAAGGEFLGDVTVPPVAELFQIGGDYIFARVLDSLDVEKVQLFRLNKGR